MLSSMAKGIQTLHSTVEIFNKYTPNVSNDDAVDTETYDMLYDWSLNHKTCVHLNGGTTPDMRELSQFLNNKANPYPWSSFNEDDSLGFLMTAISIVLPEKIYSAADQFRKIKRSFFSEEGHLCYYDVNLGVEFINVETNVKYSNFEQELVRVLIPYRMAS